MRTSPRRRPPGAAHLLNAAKLFDTVEEAIADLNFVWATTARERGQAKRVALPFEAMPESFARHASGEAHGILFGPERTGLDNDDVALADAVVTFPVNPAYASLNLAQAVLLMGYEWMRASGAAYCAVRPRREVPTGAAQHARFLSSTIWKANSRKPITSGRSARPRSCAATCATSCIA